MVTDLDSPQSQQVKKTWKPIAAGTIEIIGGILGIIVSIYWPVLSHGETVDYIIAPILFILACMALAGGITARQRKRWKLAIAGAICAFWGPIIWPGYSLLSWLPENVESYITTPAPLLPLATIYWGLWSLPLIMGIISLVFTIQSRNEFE